ncbi:twin-arginine translocation signal domain-containing protein, partial [bacterium]|nr:twin-arginine translocation signal domain-containing protein [bacterium]
MGDGKPAPKAIGLKQMTLTSKINRRHFMAGAAALGATGFPNIASAATRKEREAELATYREMYGPLPNERFPLPAVDLSKINSAYLRKYGDYATSERPGTVIVDTAN